MTFVILVVWCIVSVFAGAFEQISTADMYIGMTICPLYDIDGYCGALNAEAKHKENEMFHDCPLIEIPTPHGRLIDADALEDLVIALKRDAIHAYEWTGKSGEWSARVSERERFAVTIEDAPTIIEAEGG